jgi:transposase-like protein
VSDALLSAAEAARRLGVSRSTLYGWLVQSDQGAFQLRGQRVTIQYLQGGPRGQGRILLEPGEIDRLKDLMRVHPQRPRQPMTPRPRPTFPGIHVPLGRPDLS